MDRIVMRGIVDPQSNMFSLVSPESVVPKNHPLRPIKKLLDAALRELSPVFDEMYAQLGRPSIPPERLLKAKVLQALYTIRSETLLVESLQYNFLFRWFLDLNMTDPAWDHSVFSKNQERLLAHRTADLFFATVVGLAQEQGWVSDEHFSVDGTLIQAWASLKSFAPKDGAAKKTDDDPGNPSVDFKGQKRRNATHESTTDPEAQLMRKSAGQEAKLSYGLHALMENRHGLCVQLSVSASTTTETSQSCELLGRQIDVSEVTPASVGGDKHFHNKEFVTFCREHGIAPHVAEVKDRQVAGLDGRTTGALGYQTSQRIRKRIEEIFGWCKEIGGLRRTKHRGLERVGLNATLVVAAYNLVRMAKLLGSPP
jgi:transposase